MSTLRAVAISGSPSESSKSAQLLERAVESLERAGVETVRIVLAGLPADDLLGRTRSQAIEAAFEAVASARIVVASTPVYRASYSGLLKVFFDLLPREGLVGKIGVLIATGATAGHELVIDHSLRPLFASLGAAVVPTGTFGVDASFQKGREDPALVERVERSALEAIAFAAGTSSVETLQTGTEGTHDAHR